MIQHMMQKLFVAEDRRITKALDVLIKQNQEATGMLSDGFMYQGKFYRHSNAAAGGGARTTLDLSLWPQMERLLQEKEEIELDRRQIEQVLFRLIEPCANLQHVRDAVPDCIIDITPAEVRELGRMGRPNWQTLRDLRQYNKILPRIEFYSATRLIY
jgi:hypothetical protein